ncbi:hypothetical protein [Mycolicibacterium smegmatis]|uniref:Uncharacterized protein n=1 Tax=Mycolicibacterium smegmatis (strain MKD8) TaxID=1214915 RepID=A0A2U9PZ64_MYCSE|nr:hypothetical protein [Mycolicibacterium smegmatis]AWT57018.1 hypothetical protein D806_060800 [Mycolicibacterium smegmatis MKD8]
MNDQFDAIVQAVVHDWPDYGWSGELAAAIKHWYLTGLAFPSTWPSDRCEEFAETHADDDALFLTTSLDDLVDTVTARYERDHGVLPHHDDATLLLAAARRDVLDELELRFEVELPAEIAAATVHGLRRADNSLTACGPTQRRQISSLRRKRVRGR